MFITELSIKRPTVSWVMSLILIIFGLFVFWKLPVRELPNGIQPPVVQVQVDYKSAAASVVDQEVTQVVEDVIGDQEPKNVKGIKIKNLKTNKIDEIKLDGLFIAIGHDPATQLFKDQLKMDQEGYLITKPDSTETNVPGVYAAGDVKDKTFRQAVTAAGMGCMAALEAEKFLSH